MSAAIMARFDYGDNFIKNAVSNGDAAPGAHLDLGSPGMRFALTRMASTPTSGATATPNLTTLILGSLTQQHRRLERAQSAPAPSQNAAVVASAVNTSRYKTELCRPYEEFGVCKYGDKCQFAHGGAELRSLARHPKYKTELCRTYHTVGFCPYGPRCHFVHNQDEVVMQKQQPQQPLMVGRTRSRPTTLSPALSLDSHTSSASLSPSPTSSTISSFFSSEPELHSPTNSCSGPQTVCSGPLDDQRLPVFNRLSQIINLSDLVL